MSRNRDFALKYKLTERGEEEFRLNNVPAMEAHKRGHVYRLKISAFVNLSVGIIAFLQPFLCLTIIYYNTFPSCHLYVMHLILLRQELSLY